MVESNSVVSGGLLAVRNVDTIALQSVIPNARIIEHNNSVLAVVPHTLDVVRVLRNMDVPAPTALTTTWEYPGLYRPFSHQKKTAEFLALTHRGWVLSDTGTGKSKAALWAFDYLHRIGRRKRMLILCPKSTMHKVWVDECFETTPHLRAVVIYGYAERKEKLAEHDVDIRITNHDAIKNGKLLKKIMEGVDVVLVDEASFFKNHDTMRYKALRSMLSPTTSLWLLTATPCSKDPTDVWALARLVRPSAVPNYFLQFKRQTMYQITPFKWAVKPEAAQLVHAAMQPAIRFTKDECLDLPPVTYQSRECVLTPMQQKLSVAMQKHMVATAGTSTITAANAAVKLFKLLQIYAGVVYDNAGVPKILDAKPRLAELRDIVDTAARKVIVWVPFKHVLYNIARMLTEEGYPAEAVCGDTTTPERARIFGSFSDEASPLRVLVAHPGTAGHGLTLVSANTCVWYSPIFSAEQYLQANDRINRYGQKHHMTVIHLGGSPIEWAVYKLLRDRTVRQDSVLDLYAKVLDGSIF